MSTKARSTKGKTVPINSLRRRFLTSRETDTIIAALRVFQDPGRVDVLVDAEEIASEHGQPLTIDEIDFLVEDINTANVSESVFVSKYLLRDFKAFLELVLAGNSEFSELEHNAKSLVDKFQNFDV